MQLAGCKLFGLRQSGSVIKGMSFFLMLTEHQKERHTTSKESYLERYNFQGHATYS